MHNEDAVTIGRPSGYTPEIVESICSRVAQGENLDRLSQLDEYPSKDTLYKWLRKYPDFADEYARARLTRADARSDRIDDIGRKIIGGELQPDAARVLVDIEKWQAGKENPKRYGDKTIHTGPDGDAPATFTLKIDRNDEDVPV